jgi:O-antigen ligase
MSRSPGLGFFLFILLNATMFVRPQELFTALGELPIYNAIMLACLAVSALAVCGQLTPDSLSKNPINACAVCLLGLVILSHISHFRLREAIDSSNELIKVLVYYFLIIGLLDSFARLRKFLVWICCIMMVVVSLALLHYFGIVNIPALEAYHERQWEMIDEETGEAPVVARLQCTGIFANPNDLSRILIVGILISLYFLGDRRSSLRRALSLFLLPLYGLALNLTQSRGGLLGLFAGIGALFYDRYGGKKALLLGSIIVPILLFAFGGRQTKFSTSEGTGQERIRIWNEGFALFQGSPIFGIGMGEYAEQLRAAAHNSFLQSYVELGFIGGTCFFAMFYLTAKGLRSATPDPPSGLDPELLRLRPFLGAILIATVVGMLSANRCYALPTWLIVGICSAYVRVLSDQGRVLLPRFNAKLAGRVVVPSGVALLALYAYVRLSARY